MGADVTNVEITNISKELTRLWDEAQGQNKIRASLFNLIVYIQGGERVEHYQKMVQKVVSKFPSRVIFIIADERKDENYLNSSVSSETVGEGDLQIFCEMIKIDVGGQNKEQVPFLVIPQILADLPVYLLWTQDPTSENEILPHLEPYANRIIFDAERNINLQKFSKTIHTLSKSFSCEVGDLHWSAISGWRTLLKGAFNSAEAIETLDEAQTITISYVKGGQETEAAYIQAWLASRLGWKFQDFELIEGNIRLSYKRPTHNVVIFLKPQEANSLYPGALLSIEITSQIREMHYMFSRNPQSRQVTIQVSDIEKCELPITGYISGVKAGQEIIEEIFYPAPKHHYQSMLETLAQIPWRL